jgi:dsDNA-specific endonuclease/ATPase MutS2
MNSESDEPVEIPFSDVLDLHVFAPRDVEGVVEEWLAMAREQECKTLRIVHGRGIGVQRKRVREILARQPDVRDFGDAPVEAGGWGATVVTLR